MGKLAKIGPKNYRGFLEKWRVPILMGFYTAQSLVMHKDKTLNSKITSIILIAKNLSSPVIEGNIMQGDDSDN